MVNSPFHQTMKQAKLSIVDSILENWPFELNGQLSFTIALSGGIDSIVLLDIFHRISQRKAIKLQAIHVNHNISANAPHWAEFCKTICQNYGVPLDIYSTQVVKISGKGLENSARKARYHAFFENESDVIVLAHHQNDQIETMLSQIMRGSSIANCAGMMVVSKKKDKLFWRPLLELTKHEIQEYAVQNNLKNIEDESNQDNQYLRNFIRNDIMPRLEEHDPNISTKLIQFTHTLQSAALLMNDLAEIDLLKYSDNNKIHKHNFLELSTSRQLNLLNYFILQNNLPLVSQKQLSEFCRQLQSKQHPEITLNITKSSSLISSRSSIFITHQ